jgi:hypothetical protein
LTPTKDEFDLSMVPKTFTKLFIVRRMLAHCYSGHAVWHSRLPLTDNCGAVQLLREHNVLSMPVVDENEQFLGVFSVTDLFCAMVKGA